MPPCASATGGSTAAPDPTAAGLIVDALNVIGSRPDGWWRDRQGAIRALVERLRVYAVASASPLTVVIDGRPLPDLPEGEDEGVVVRYAPRRGPDAADDRIVELVAERGGAGMRVVTADRDLRTRVEALGATTLGPSSFLEALDRVTNA